MSNPFSILDIYDLGVTIVKVAVAAIISATIVHQIIA